MKKAAEKKALAKKVVGKKAVTKKTVTKTTTVKKVAVKKVAVKKVVAPKVVAQKTAVKKPEVKKVAAKKLAPTSLPEQMRDAALKILDERKAENIATYDLSGRSSMADYLIIASGQASRQIAAIAHYLNDAFRKLGARDVRIEGIGGGDWVIIDSGDVIVHLFRPEVRDYYKLEDIWDRKAQ